jgi:hypothetical protein
MRVFWNDRGRGLGSDCAEEVDVKEATRIWLDEVRGVQSNFLGLIDDQGNIIQFYFDASIPDDVDDASHLKIVRMDFPQPRRKGSYAAHVTIGEVQRLIEKAFKLGAYYRKYPGVTFMPW